MIRAFAVVGSDIGAPDHYCYRWCFEALVATATGFDRGHYCLYGFHELRTAKVNDFRATLEHECGNILDAYNEEHDI